MPPMSRVQSFSFFHVSRAALAAWLLTASVAVFAQATPAVSTVFAFNGSIPNGGIVQGGPDGGLYGTSASNTLVAGGLIYRSTVNGSSVTTIYQMTLDDGYGPKAGLLQGSDGLLYGSTRLGLRTIAFTTGTIYRVGYDGTGYTTLHSFQDYSVVNVNGNPINADGAYPETPLIEGSDGYLYGTTRAGGIHGTGVIFRMARDGTEFSLLHYFGPVTSDANDNPPKNGDGASPIGRLLQVGNYLYGVASGGGVTGRGTIYRIGIDGAGFEVVHEFAAISDTSPYGNVGGATPLVGLTDGGDGFLYGAASLGGTTGVGTLFSIKLDGLVFEVMHEFDGPGGATPSGALIVGSDSLLYGTTANGGTNSSGTTTTLGTIYSFERGGAGFTKLYSFNGDEGSFPNGPLLQLDATSFVGVTISGGKCGQGTLFHFSTTGEKVSGNTTCGQKKKNQNGGGAVAPGMLLLLGGLALARRRRRG
jgi:uncharacterized repeat protein (TIGR03803 family)